MNEDSIDSLIKIFAEDAVKYEADPYRGSFNLCDALCTICKEIKALKDLLSKRKE